MEWKQRFLALPVALGLVVGSALAAPQTEKPLAKKPNANASKTPGRWAQEKGVCEGFDAKAKELTSQERQLLAQAREKETEAKSLVAQAAQVERQRVAEEHSLKRGDTAGEARLKEQEQQRVSLEHQATEKEKERGALIRQADELARQRREVETQRKEQCTFGKGAKAAH